MSQDGCADVSAERKVGLVIVHGVGETEPGWCINAVLQNLKSRDPAYRVDAHNTFFRLDERDEKEREPKQVDAAAEPESKWPVFLQCAAYEPKGGGEKLAITGAEVYWADTTTIDPGRFSTILGLIRVIFESQHLVHAMLYRTGHAAAWLARNILVVAAWMLRGPIAALTLATSAFCIAVLFEPDFVRVVPAEVQFLAIQGALIAVSGYLFHRIRKSHDLSWYDFVFWLAAFSGALLVLALAERLLDVLNYVPSLRPSLAELWSGEWTSGCLLNDRFDYRAICGLYAIIIWSWRFWALLLAICVALLLYEWLIAKFSGNRAIYDRMATSIAILMMQFMLWTTVIVSLLYPMLNRAEANAAIGALTQAAEVQLLKPTFERDPEVKALFDVPNIHQDWIPRFKFVYVATTGALVGLIVGGVVLMRVRRRRAREGLKGLEGDERQRQLEANFARVPRFLFNPKLAFFLIVVFLLIIYLVTQQPKLEKDETFLWFRGIFLPLAALIALLVPLAFGPVITNVVHIARDLIDHQFQPRLETAANFLPGAFRMTSKTPRRDRIAERLIKVLRDFVKREKFDDIIFVAHSQGSIIAYDYLVKHEEAFAGLGEAAPSLLTFGSPLGTIYQKYFPFEYEEKFPVPPELSRRLKRWVNLYRVDDYIGGPINPPETLQISNRLMPPGLHMHTNYWTEPELAEALDELIRRKRPRAGLEDMAALPRMMPRLWAPPARQSANLEDAAHWPRSMPRL